MTFRFTPHLKGAHVWVAVFVASGPDTTFEKMGDLTMRADEWARFRTMFKADPSLTGIDVEAD